MVLALIFTQWVKTFINNTGSCVMNRGKSTRYFPLKRGTRQGDPLSAYLLILALEVMLTQIRKDDSLRGITAEDTVIKLSAYADDTYFLVKIRAPSSQYLQQQNIIFSILLVL